MTSPVQNPGLKRSRTCCPTGSDLEVSLYQGVLGGSTWLRLQPSTARTDDAAEHASVPTADADHPATATTTTSTTAAAAATASTTTTTEATADESSDCRAASA